MMIIYMLILLDDGDEDLNGGKTKLDYDEDENL